MYPVVFGAIPSYFALWAVAALTALAAGVFLVRREEPHASVPRVTLGLLLCIVVVLAVSVR